MTVEQGELLEKNDDCINEMRSIVEQENFNYACWLGGRHGLAMLMDNGEEA